MKKIILMLAFVFALPIPSHAANWYVDNSVASSGNGQAWSTAWKNFSDVVWGGAGVVAGDTLYISGGAAGQTYAEILQVGASGSSGNPITIRPGSDAGHNGKVVIDAQNTRASCIRLNGYNYITIDGISGDALAGNTTYGMLLCNWTVDGGVYTSSGSSNIVVQHVEFTGTNTTSTSDYQACVNIYTGGTGYEVAYCWGHGSESARPQVQDPSKWHTSGVILWSALSGTTYTLTKVHDNKFEIMYHDGIKVNNNASIYNNEVCDIGGSAHSDSLLLQSSTYGAIYGNYVHGRNEQCIYIDCLTATGGHTRVYNNVVNGGSQGVVLDPEGTACVIDDVLIANNTFYTTGGENVRGPSRGNITNLRIINNIFGVCTVGGYYQLDKRSSWSLADANALDYNVYKTGSANSPNIMAYETVAKTLAQARALSPARETHGNYANPVFVDAANSDFHLSSSDTVATGAGVNLSAYFTTDKDGNTRSTWDVGAYAASAPAPPVAPFRRKVIHWKYQ